METKEKIKPLKTMFKLILSLLFFVAYAEAGAGQESPVVTPETRIVRVDGYIFRAYQADGTQGPVDRFYAYLGAHPYRVLTVNEDADGRPFVNGSPSNPIEILLAKSQLLLGKLNELQKEELRAAAKKSCETNDKSALKQKYGELEASVLSPLVVRK